MSLFHRALRRVVAAVYQTFDSDEGLQSWLVALRTTDVAEREEATARLKHMLDKLETGWVSAMLLNEDRTEEVGVLGQAIAAELSGSSTPLPTRSVFSYRLASQIVNKGVRLLNRSARGLEYQTASQTVLQPSPAADSVIGADVRAGYDKYVAALLERETRSNQVATAKITMDVARVWLDAISDVQVEAGSSHARPMSAAVKTKIASRLNLPISTVEAAMKRYKRAIQKVRERTVQP